MRSGPRAGHEGKRNRRKVFEFMPMVEARTQFPPLSPFVQLVIKGLLLFLKTSFCGNLCGSLLYQFSRKEEPKNGWEGAAGGRRGVQAKQLNAADMRHP